LPDGAQIYQNTKKYQISIWLYFGGPGIENIVIFMPMDICCVLVNLKAFWYILWLFDKCTYARFGVL
jgi:hypothetical protein